MWCWRPAMPHLVMLVHLASRWGAAGAHLLPGNTSPIEIPHILKVIHQHGSPPPISFDFFWSSHQQRYLYHLYEAELNQFQTEYFASMYLSLIIKMDDWEFWKNQFPPQILPVEAAGPVSALNHFLPILSSSTIKTILFYHSSSKFSFSFVKIKISFIFAKSAPIIGHHNLKSS